MYKIYVSFGQNGLVMAMDLKLCLKNCNAWKCLTSVIYLSLVEVMYYVCSYVLLCQTWECFVSVTQYCSAVNIDLMNFALNKSKKNVSNGDNI